MLFLVESLMSCAPVRRSLITKESQENSISRLLSEQSSEIDIMLRVMVGAHKTLDNNKDLEEVAGKEVELM